MLRSIGVAVFCLALLSACGKDNHKTNVATPAKASDNGNNLEHPLPTKPADGGIAAPDKKPRSIEVHAIVDSEPTLWTDIQGGRSAVMLSGNSDRIEMDPNYPHFLELDRAESFEVAWPTKGSCVLDNKMAELTKGSDGYQLHFAIGGRGDACVSFANAAANQGLSLKLINVPSDDDTVLESVTIHIHWNNTAR